MLELVDRALQFATVRHQGQTRKDPERTPYIYHPAMTGFYLQKHGMDEELVAAAILHDTVEDTSATLDEIKQLFGERVWYLVKCSTEDKDKSWEERKQAQMDGIRVYEPDALFVKLADKLHNISCTYCQMMQTGERPFARMNRGYDQQEWYFNGLVTAFESRPEVNQHPLFLEFKETVSKVFMQPSGHINLKKLSNELLQAEPNKKRQKEQSGHTRHVKRRGDVPYALRQLLSKPPSFN